MRDLVIASMLTAYFGLGASREYVDHQRETSLPSIPTVLRAVIGLDAGSSEARISNNL